MKTILPVFLVLLSLACQDKQAQFEPITADNLNEAQIDSVLTAFKFNYEVPIILDSSDYVLIPISTDLFKTEKSYGSLSGFSKGGKYSKNRPRYWNVLFYNRITGLTRLLTEDKINISRIDVNQKQGKESVTASMRQKIFYEICKVDLNKDNFLNYKDPKYLFSSAVNGEKLERISPEGETLQYYKLLPKTDQILIKTLRDTNQDLRFDGKDESIWYKAEWIDNNWNIKEMIDSTGREKIENLYFEQWLKK